MSLARITDHVQRALEALVPEYWGKPRMGALIAAYALEVQTLEDTQWEIFEAQHIDTADLARLIVIGKGIGQVRGILDLEHLRTAIKARGLANRSKGRGPDIGAVLGELFGDAAVDFDFIWPGPATMQVLIKYETTAQDVAMVLSVLPHARAAGVRFNVLFSPESALAYDYASDGWILADSVDPITTPGAPWFDCRIA